MPRAASLSSASKANRAKAGAKPAGPGRRAGGGVNLPNLPQFEGPPPGTFDPGLEAEVRAAERGLIDLIEKTRREGHRESVDTRQARELLERKVRWAKADLARRQGYAVQDAGTEQSRLGTSFQRDIEDLAQAKQRGEQDYQNKLTELQHSYATRAAVQQQAAVAQGTSEAGTEAASGAVRAANQAHDKAGIDLANSRFLEDNALAEQRAHEDFATRSGLIQQGLGRDLTQFGVQGFRLGKEETTQRRQLAHQIQRATVDRHTALSHAKREYGIYATDVAQQAYYQAHQLNPNIQFPSPSAAAHPGAGGSAPHPVQQPAVGVGQPPHRPHVYNPAIGTNVGLGRARTDFVFHRRPYLRY